MFWIRFNVALLIGLCLSFAPRAGDAATARPTPPAAAQPKPATAPKAEAANASKPAELADKNAFPAAAEQEIAANVRLYSSLTRWDAESMRQLIQSVTGASEPIAFQALWLAASAPPRVSALDVFFAAMDSPSPAVRRQAASIMAGLDAPEVLRQLLDRLIVKNQDPETLRYVISALAVKPSKIAVRNLMIVLLAPGLPPDLATVTTTQLRNLTRTNLSNSPAEWKNWWQTHARQYD